jgi:hypothetical protein
VEFLVVLPDDRQESADVAQIVRLYRDRQINAESLVWRDGMDEWKAVWDVDEIATAFRRMGYARPSQPAARPSSQPAQANYDDSSDVSTHVVPSSRPPAPAPVPAPAFDEDEATSVVDSSAYAAPQAGVRKVEEGDDDPTGVVPSPMDLALAPQPVAQAAARKHSERPIGRVTTRRDGPAYTARSANAEPTPSPAAVHARAETRQRAQTREDSRARNQGLDIFAEQAHRAAEHELAPAVEDDGARLTGARGENSVLFSLDALVRQEQQKQRPLVLPPRARTDESVLVDSSPSLPSGVGGAALAAPDFTAPISAPPPRIVEAVGDLDYPRPKKGGWLAPIIVLLLVGLGGFAWASGRLRPLLAAVGLASPSAAPSASAVPEDSAKAQPSAGEASSAAPETSAAPDASAAPSAAPSAKALAATGKTPSLQAKPPPTGTAKASDEPAPKETAAKPSGGGEFDTAAAKAALTAAANNASSCREATGPMGGGKVSITFAPSGRPTSVAVTGELAGTTVGSCVARLFRAARVPPFSGDPVSVSKAFTVK